MNNLKIYFKILGISVKPLISLINEIM